MYSNIYFPKFIISIKQVFDIIKNNLQKPKSKWPILHCLHCLRYSGGITIRRNAFTLIRKNWYTSIFESLTPIQFYEYFRMSKNKFEGIFQVLYLDTTNISKKDFKRNLLIFLFYTGHSNVLRSIRELFGIPLATPFRIIEKQVASFIQSQLNIFVYPD